MSESSDPSCGGPQTAILTEKINKLMKENLLTTRKPHFSRIEQRSERIVWALLGWE